MEISIRGKTLTLGKIMIKFQSRLERFPYNFRYCWQTNPIQWNLVFNKFPELKIWIAHSHKLMRHHMQTAKLTLA